MRQQPLTHWSMPTHAASLSPFLVPLSHPSATPLLPTFLPYSGCPSLSLPLALAPSPFLSLSLSLFPSLIPPSINLFLSRARRSLSLYLPPDSISPSHDVGFLSLGTLARSHALSLVLSFPSTLLRYGSRAGHTVGSRESLRSIYRTPI